MRARFIVIAAYLADITEKLSLLSKMLQVDYLKYKLMRAAVKATQDGLHTTTTLKIFSTTLKRYHIKKIQ